MALQCSSKSHLNTLYFLIHKEGMPIYFTPFHHIFFVDYSGNVYYESNLYDHLTIHQHHYAGHDQSIKNTPLEINDALFTER